MSDDLEIRPYREGDEHGIVACYNRVFPLPGAGIPERTLEHWRWKFRDNPARRMLHMLAVHRDRGVVGIYAGIPVRIWVEQEPRLAAQGVDFCVLPEWRRHGSDPGLFVALGRAYIDTWHGSERDDVLFTYGWPVPAWSKGQKHLGWINVRDWDCTFRELGDAPPRSVPDELETRAVPRLGADVDALFDAVKPTLGLALVRDRAYFDWRYARAPDRRYVLYECRERRSGNLRGVCVYAARSPIRADSAFIADWLHHAGDRDTMASMLAAAEERAKRDGADFLGSFWNHLDPRFLELQREGYLVLGTRYFLVLARAKYDTRFFREQWYFTMGDSDLV